MFFFKESGETIEQGALLSVLAFLLKNPWTSHHDLPYHPPELDMHDMCPRSRHLIFITLMSLLVGVTGCGPIKFYPGEERADSEVGRILFNSTGAEMIAVTIDGTPHPHPGRTVEVLPGPHRIEVKYQEDTNGSDSVPAAESILQRGQTSAPTVRFGSCTIKFTIDAAQELFVYVSAGSTRSVPAATPPTITLKEQGYYKPALYQERCQEDGRRATIR
jgi:hypothetical protein